MVRQVTQEKCCYDITFERKFFRTGKSIIKRSLKAKEFGQGVDGPHVPRLSYKRLQNEAAALQFIRNNTNIPVPTVFAHFEDDDAYYLVTEYIPGISMCNLSERDKKRIHPELQRVQNLLKRLRSDKLGGPSGLLVPPYRVLRRSDRNDWRPLPPPPRQSDCAQQQLPYAFCHNDLNQSNIIVDTATWKIAGIIDWEYAGFYPDNFEYPFYRRLGPSAAINNERDDSYEMLAFLEEKCTEAEEVPDVRHPPRPESPYFGL